MKYSLLKMLFVTIIVLSAYGGFASSLFYYLNEPDDTYISNSMLSDSQKNADLLLVNNFISNLKNSPLNKDNNKLIIDDSINRHKRFVQQGLFTPMSFG